MKHKPLDTGERWALMDYDDVLGNWIRGFGAFFSADQKRAISGMPDSWDMASWLGVQGSQVVGFINRFNEQEEAFAHIEPMPGAVRGVRALRAFGFRTAIITSSSVHPSSVERRARNVSANFGSMIERLHIVPLGETKEHVLSAYTNAIWVEDNIKNAIMGARMGHRSFLMRAGHNASFHGKPHDQDGLVHVRDWPELIRRVLGITPDPLSALPVDPASIALIGRGFGEAVGGEWVVQDRPMLEAIRSINEAAGIGLVRVRKDGDAVLARATRIGEAALVRGEHAAEMCRAAP